MFPAATKFKFINLCMELVCQILVLNYALYNMVSSLCSPLTDQAITSSSVTFTSTSSIMSYTISPTTSATVNPTATTGKKLKQS